MITCFLLAGAVYTQDTTRLTLDQALQRALASYPTVAVARAQRERAAADLGEAQSSRLPSVGLDGQLFRYEKPNVVAPLHALDLRNPPLFDRTLIQSGLSFNWTILDFGNRSSRVTAERALAGAADAGVSAAELALTARTVNGYLAVLTTRDELVAQDERLAALASESERTRQLLAEGKAARIEGLRVNAETKRAQADRIAGASQVDIAEHELAQLSGLPFDSVHRWRLGELRLLDSAALARDSVVGRAQQSSTDLRELQERARAARAGLAAARATWFPELQLTGGYLENGRWVGAFQGEWRIGVAMSYPIFTGGSRTSAVRRASADQQSADQQLRAARLNVDQAVDRSLAALSEAHARVAALVTAVEQSQEVARIERLSLDVGSGTQTEYLDAEANLLRARATLIEARHEEISARVELARITGELSRDWLAHILESAP